MYVDNAMSRIQMLSVSTYFLMLYGIYALNSLFFCFEHIFLAFVLKIRYRSIAKMSSAL
jgi:hypothetical protein